MVAYKFLKVMKHFLEISQIPYNTVVSLIERAIAFKKMTHYPKYLGNNLVNLFYENSTRTRVSFQLAANNLGINVVNLDKNFSSEKKGETIEDTIHTLMAMGINLFVIRHPQNGFAQAIAGLLKENVHIINAGDGTHSHPSQALLDFMTIREQHPDLEKLKIAIVGDISHSRVANSLQNLCALFAVKDLVMIAPEIWQPKSVLYGRVTTSLKQGLQDADVIISLRIQRERLEANSLIDLADFHNNYALTKQSIKYAKPKAMIMHPGPINRGVEIDSDIADGENSFILQQVTNGVFMRMAIIEALLNSELEYLKS